MPSYDSLQLLNYYAICDFHINKFKQNFVKITFNNINSILKKDGSKTWLLNKNVFGKKTNEKVSKNRYSVF